jgi:hypothetical protein
MYNEMHPIDKLINEYRAEFGASRLTAINMVRKHNPASFAAWVEYNDAKVRYFVSLGGSSRNVSVGMDSLDNYK